MEQLPKRLGTHPRRLLFAAPLAAMIAALPASAQGPTRIMSAVQGSRTISILSYNVEGLPWPAASGRSNAADEIAASLEAQRQAGTAPHVVALQEAFGPDQKRIGRKAGYNYAAFGPSHRFASSSPQTTDDRRFVDQASAWLGETLGKHANSGLAVFSDYPIVWTKRIAYPDYACAGWDCLANKGALAVALAVPGYSQPVVVVDTHLNSRSASHAANTRSLHAYQRQVDLLQRFVDQAAQGAGAVILTGDFNVGLDPVRQAYLGRHLLGADNLALAAEETECGQDCREMADPAAVTAADLKGAKSLIAFRDTVSTVTPGGRPTVFGLKPDGGMLSDHIGLAVRFRSVSMNGPFRKG
jgi:endonuclease/exonuclease/phosphatase family metal-dependent hydrolase